MQLSYPNWYLSFFAWKVNIFTGELYQTGSTATGPGSSVSNLLLETSDNILQEDGISVFTLE